MLAPGPNELIASAKIVLFMKRTRDIQRLGSLIASETPLADAVGDILSGKIINKVVLKHVRPMIKDAYNHVEATNISHLNNGYGWINKSGRLKYAVVFHDADKAGAHLDIHFENGVSFIRRVKPHVYSKLRYGKDGSLTIDSKKSLMAFLDDEINNNTRTPQNIDHKWGSETHYLWMKRDDSRIADGSYGAGNTRQIVSEGEVEVIKVSGEKGQTATLYMPDLDPHRLVYLHHLYPGTDKRAPIAIIGKTIKTAPKLDDKLHLKLVNDLDTFKDKVGVGTTTIKYDGASAIIVSDKDSAVPFSPRVSKKTGEHINYLGKVPETAKIHTDKRWIVRGELMFQDKGKFIPAHEVGGILNSHSLRPRRLSPAIYIYRVEMADGVKTPKLTYEQNRNLLKEYRKLNPQLLHLPKELKHDEIDRVSNIEGFVGIPDGCSLDDGFKFKFLGDENDWKVTNIQLEEGRTGRTAGIVHFVSLESGKEFKLGPGQLGSEEFVRDIMARPDDYIDKVYKVSSRLGHEGRASKLVCEHMDK